METDSLQQLRDVHLPADPSWWPPALGWWLMAIATIVLIYLGIRTALSWWRKGAPLRYAKKLHAANMTAFAAGDITATQFTQRSNELLKRLLAVAYQRQELTSLSGDAWLNALDEIAQAPVFSTGSGRSLGDERFKPEPAINADELGAHISTLLTKVRT